ncbi:nucleotidyltransferase domain-containing protein [Halanaerobiaceae bacterium Z-7014]|uniref:Nucleotidyltransferase domain-containing protein n=1 Tax=Halonatronomonas betaini TaxID=2778430 RepID=A0A931AY83_9FIRM|nr:nucleotidyltransferase domain-containing protein [Halonatronomonas betaini]
MDSDIDLLIVVDAKDPENIKEIRRGINKLLADREMPVDIIVISSEKMDQRKDVPGTLPYICIREGEILYEREG